MQRKREEELIFIGMVGRNRSWSRSRRVGVGAEVGVTGVRIGALSKVGV